MTGNPLVEWVHEHLDVELTPWQQEMLSRLWLSRTPKRDVIEVGLLPEPVDGTTLVVEYTGTTEVVQRIDEKARREYPRKP